jgi:flagellar hook protein FlgE
MSLISTLTSGVSALRSFSTGLQNIGNDIANVSTTSYKKANVSFADTFAGIGVQAKGVTTNYSQGSLETTGNVTDLGISGNGFFIVKDVSGNQFATRDGNFHFDANGALVNAQGYHLQGLTGGTATTAISSSSAIGDITLADLSSTPALQRSSVSVDTAGRVTEFTPTARRP